MITQTNYFVNDKIKKEIKSADRIAIGFKLPLNQPTADFFYDVWTIKEEYKGTVWDKLLSTLPNNIGEARLINLEPGQAYRSHADMDDRYHFNIQGERSFVIYTDANVIYPQVESNYWSDMNAGELHSAVNTGRINRIQLVVRKLLNKNVLIDPVHIKMTQKEFNPDYRYVFDEFYSPWLNAANKNGIVNSFVYNYDYVSFNIESRYLEEFKLIESSYFNLLIGPAI
tara:strand:- start:9265 stop:9945 length:681 start_codon:yes stop_codon:yes gene_type:complete